jgi:hypothetical protein
MWGHRICTETNQERRAMPDLSTTQIVLLTAAFVFNAALVWTAICLVAADRGPRFPAVLQGRGAQRG